MMGTPRKVRADATLKMLSERRQDELAEYGRTHTLKKTLEWLKKGGVEISVGPLSIFLAEYRIREQLQRTAAVVNLALLAELKKDPSLTPEVVQKLGQSYFSGLAIEEKNPQVWEMTQGIELKKGKLELEWEKHRDEAKVRREKIRKGLKAAKKGGGISTETLEQIERELKLM